MTKFQQMKSLPVARLSRADLGTSHYCESLQSSSVRLSGIEPLTDPALTVKRTGRYVMQLFSGQDSRELSLESTGPTPLRTLRQAGHERTYLDVDGTVRTGVESIVDTLDQIEALNLSSDKLLQHHDGRPRRFKVGSRMPGQWTGAVVVGGVDIIDISTYQNTGASVSFDYTTSNSFVYRGAGDEQIYSVWVIPQNWDDGTLHPAAPRDLGMFQLATTNASTGRHLFTRDGLQLGTAAPGNLVYVPFENELRMSFPNEVSVNDLIRVDLIHKGFASSDNRDDYKYLGAATGFTFAMTVLA